MPIISASTICGASQPAKPLKFQPTAFKKFHLFRGKSLTSCSAPPGEDGERAQPEKFIFGPNSAIRASNRPANSITCNEISYANETGNFRGHNREFFSKEQGIPAQKQGIRPASAHGPPLCVPAQSLRAFMSSIIRWRSGLTDSVLIGNSCLG